MRRFVGLATSALEEDMGGAESRLKRVDASLACEQPERLSLYVRLKVARNAARRCNVDAAELAFLFAALLAAFVWTLRPSSGPGLDLRAITSVLKITFELPATGIAESERASAWFLLLECVFADF